MRSVCSRIPMFEVRSRSIMEKPMKQGLCTSRTTPSSTWLTVTVPSRDWIPPNAGQFHGGALSALSMKDLGIKASSEYVCGALTCASVDHVDDPCKLQGRGSCSRFSSRFGNIRTYFLTCLGSSRRRPTAAASR